MIVKADSGHSLAQVHRAFDVGSGNFLSKGMVIVLKAFRGCGARRKMAGRCDVSSWGVAPADPGSSGCVLLACWRLITTEWAERLVRADAAETVGLVGAPCAG